MLPPSIYDDENGDGYEDDGCCPGCGADTPRGCDCRGEDLDWPGDW